jgi:23S rRNA G2445 N2-methylase RlmL
VTPTRTLCEVDVVEGIETIARDEIKRRLGCDARQVAPGRLQFTFDGDIGRLETLQTALAAYVVQRFAVPRPRALLGDQHLRALLALIERARAPQRAAYGTFMLAAAGRDSAVLTRLAGEIARATGLREVPEDGDLLVRLRRAGPEEDAGWEALVRTSPRPLATRDWRACNIDGSLQATVAHAMAVLSRPQRDDVYLNLCCGSGTLLIERALAGPAARLIGCDIDPAALACARRNVDRLRRAAPIDLEPWDATRLPLRDASVDALATDLPFGHRVGSHADNEALYPAVLSEAARVAKPGARLVTITAEMRLMDRLLRDPGSPWQLEQMLRVNLGGLRPTMYVLQRKVHTIPASGEGLSARH